MNERRRMANRYGGWGALIGLLGGAALGFAQQTLRSKPSRFKGEALVVTDSADLISYAIAGAFLVGIVGFIVGLVRGGKPPA